MGQCGSKKENTNTGVNKPNLLENTKQEPTKVETAPNVLAEIKEEPKVEETVEVVEVETTEVDKTTAVETVAIDVTECDTEAIVEEHTITREANGTECCAHEACCEEAEEKKEEEAQKEQEESSTTAILIHEDKGEGDEKEQDGGQEPLSTSRFQDDAQMEVPTAISVDSVPATLQSQIHDSPVSKESKTTNPLVMDDDESITAGAFCNICAAVKKDESIGNITVSQVWGRATTFCITSTARVIRKIDRYKAGCIILLV